MEQLTFIGDGHLVRSMVIGLLGQHYDANAITIVGKHADKLLFFKQQLKVNTTLNIQSISTKTDWLFLCVRPLQIASLCKTLCHEDLSSIKGIVSVAAGITIAALQQQLPPGIPIIRAMPNITAAIQSSPTTLYTTKETSHTVKETIEALMRLLGPLFWLEQEPLIDIATALAGSGPAYVFLFMEALEEAATQLGLPEELATLLTKEMFLGTARFALETTETIPSLRKHSATPGGTTEQALHMLETLGIKNMAFQALNAAFQKARLISLTCPTKQAQ